MLVQRSQAGAVMFSAQLIKHQIYHWRPRWGQTYRRRGQIMRVMGLVLPPWFCWCTGCELKGSIMFLHAWVSTCIWQANRDWEQLSMHFWKLAPQITGFLASRLNTVQTADIPEAFWSRNMEKSVARKLECSFLWRKIMERAHHGKESLRRKRVKWKIPSSSTVFTHQLFSTPSSVGYFCFLCALCCF